ncbi:MAG: hypothetical protein QXL94_08225 [Candidatus Parvarchaeum sp.]
MNKTIITRKWNHESQSEEVKKYEVPSALYDAYIALYATNREHPELWLELNRKMMSLHHAICDAIGVTYTMDDTDEFYSAFHEQVLLDSGIISPSDRFIEKSMLKEANEKFNQLERNSTLDYSVAKTAFTQLKDHAAARYDLEKELNRALEKLFGVNEIPPIDSVSQIDWQDVLVWGIEDGSFEEFISDIQKALKMIEEVK